MTLQNGWAASFWYLPPGHGSHALGWSFTLEKVPLAQFSHCFVARLTNVPGVHGMQKPPNEDAQLALVAPLAQVPQGLHALLPASSW